MAKLSMILLVLFFLCFTQDGLIAQDQFTEQTSISLLQVQESSVEWGDYDNDGDLDILLAGYYNGLGVTKIYRNNGNNTFSDQSSINLAGADIGSVKWGDYDNDGDLDILLTGWTGTSEVSKIYRNNGDNTFTEQTGISLTGVSFSSAAWGDYDNDGDLDILITGSTSTDAEVSKIYKNNGDNTFTEQTSISLVGVNMSSVAWGDYDNDGDLDILLTGAIGNESAQVTKIYTNNGNNTFTDEVSISLVNVWGSSVAWGDYDNDGDLDILISGWAGLTIGRVTKVYRNNGNSTFTEQTSISLTGVVYSSVAWGDYDNDGDLDILLSGDTGSSKVSKIYKNNGDNTFSEQTAIILTGVDRSSLAWGDYDNDGDLDIVLTGFDGTNNVTKIYRNNNPTVNTKPDAPTNLTTSISGNDVTFSWDKSTDNQTPQNGLKYNLVIGTAPNGVNKLAPMADRNTGYRRVIGLGNTNHKNSWTITGLAAGTYYWSVQAIDNAFAGSPFAETKSFIIGSHTSQFTEQTSINLTGVSNSSAAWGDYDNDGDLDILLTGHDGNAPVSKIYKNNGNNSFTEQTSILLTGVYHSSVAWGDYDNDGDLDILLSGSTKPSAYSSPCTKLYKNNGDNTFSEQSQLTLTQVESCAVSWGDYDNDGDLDALLVGNAINPSAIINENNGDGTFTAQNSIPLTGVFDGAAAFGDYDNDGDLDIVLTGTTGSSNISKIYRNNGNNTFSEQASIELSSVKLSCTAWGDYDNDKDLDLVIAGSGNSGVVSKVYKNNANNTFTELSSPSLVGVIAGSAAWGDYDNDGDLDLLLAGASGNELISKVYRNNGNDTFVDQTSITLPGVFACSSAWGDYDNDGDLDILITGYNGMNGISKIFQNNNSTPNILPTTPTNLSSTVIEQDAILSWDKSTDGETPQDGLTYNLVISNTSNGVDKLSPMSDRQTGYRKVVQLGNTNNNNSWTIKGLQNGVYYWSIQAIDNNFAGSNFSPEKTFSVGPPIINWSDTLKINDNGGENGKLIFGQSYYGTDSIDLQLGESSLPPLPPLGIFDARFELPTNPNDYSLADFRDDTLKAREWVVKFQTGIGGYPITFTWDPQSLPKGLFYLKDVFTGSIVNVNMKENDSYTLTNTGITSLKIEYSTVPIAWDAVILAKDNGGLMQNLTIGQSEYATDGIDNELSEAPLPPPPPAGSFDARFELPSLPVEGSYIDYRSDTCKTITWLIKFQPGSGGYPFTFIWNPSELPDGFFYLKDNISGSIVNVDMKSSNTYTLTNTSITSLKLEYSQQICINVSLNQGWNIASVPVLAADMSTQTLFPDFNSPTYSYDNGYRSVTTLENGLGYWIRYANTGIVSICGIPAGANTIPVHAGWNIIGVYDQNIPVANITTTPASILTSQFYGFNGGYTQPATLEVGKGYWIRASQNGVINISNVLSKSNHKQSVTQTLDPSWARISITDNTGKKGIVYIGKGNIDFKYFDLPPAPPNGTFDVRFASNRYVELYNSVNEILISSASYPITIHTDGMDLRIKDSFTGGIIDKVIRNGESFTVEDNAMNKFLIGEAEIPDDYTLFQNYPNPFNPSTTIKFGLPENSKVVITIFNQLGEKIAVLAEKDFEAGYHTLTWHASDLASGLYFYELKTKAFSAVKKLLLMK